MIVTRDMLEESLATLTREIREPRHGIYGPSSVSWQLAGDVAVFLGGGRAALLQLAHPFVAYAIAEHSRTRSDVVGRFQRTFRNVFAMTFGELDAALAAARRVHAVHARIAGALPERVGSWAAGTRYAATDDATLRWVHATLVDTVLVVRERLDGELPVAIKDAYVVEQNRFARLFGLRDALLPRSWAEHAAYMERAFATLAVSPPAREMGAFLVGRGGGRQPALGRVAESITATLLPRHLVSAFGLEDSPRTTAAVHAALAVFAPLYRRLPARAIALPARSEAVRRIAGKPRSALDAWTERQLFGLAQRTTGA